MNILKQRTIPTSIITGFLGVGKTTSILNLLSSKPANERWAVLVNEFGEIGIDGAILKSSVQSDNNVFVQEVPGGCMCCASSLPMQVALSRLIRESKPHRLIIEPTGLGHPQEVLRALNQPNFHGLLDVQNVLTILDARHLGNPKVRENDIFREQVDIANVLIANKSDLYSEVDYKNLDLFLKQGDLDSRLEIQHAVHGVFDTKLLEVHTNKTDNKPSYSLLTGDATTTDESVEFKQDSEDGSGISRAQNIGEGFQSIGWCLDKRYVFAKNRLDLLFSGLEVERLKAIVNTTDGTVTYNLAQGVLTEMSCGDLGESRIEIIAPTLNPNWEGLLLDCLQSEDQSSKNLNSLHR